MPSFVKKAKAPMRNLVPPPPKGEQMTEPEPYVPNGPHIYIDVDVPELDGREVGSEFTFKGKARLKSTEERKDKRGNRKSYALEMLEIGVE